MKKSSIEMLVALSSIYSKKQISDFGKDLRSLTAAQIERLIARLLEQRSRSFSIIAQEVSVQENEGATTGTADEISYLLLTRYKLKVPIAVDKLSEQLARQGYRLAFDDRPTRANFLKWLERVCDEVPRKEIMSAALDLRPPQR